MSQFATGPYSELRVHVAQGPFDGLWAVDQTGADLRVRQPVACEFGDLTLLGGEIVEGLRAVATALVAGGGELVGGTLRERLHAHGHEHLVREGEHGSRVESATVARQPLAVQQLS